MQRDALEPVLDALSGVRTGARLATVAGLSVSTLREPPRAEPVGGAGGAVLADAHRPAIADAAPPPVRLRWSEASPARPGRLRVDNPGPRTAVVDAGTLISGGMSSRAVSATTLVPPHGSVLLGVEPLGARWWDGGAPRRTGRLAPVAAALLLQAALAPAALASPARTAIWDLGDALLEDGGIGPDGAGGRGWALWDGDDLLAAWLAERGRGDRPDRDRTRARLAGAGIAASLQRGVDRGRLEPHELRLGGAGRDVAVIPRSLELVDRIAAGVAPSALVAARR